jgi:hypothetical protein
MVAVKNDGKVTRRRVFSGSFFRSPSEGEAVALQSAEAVTAIVRITGRGNLRLLHRRLAQVARLMEINGLRVATRAVCSIGTGATPAHVLP